MKTRPITRRRFADLAAVSRQAVAAALRGPLRAALVGNGRIDVASVAAQRYLHSHGRAYEAGLMLNDVAPQIELGLDSEPTPPSEESTLDAAEPDYDIEAIPPEARDLTLLEIMNRHGTESWARPVLDCLKRVEEIRMRRVSNIAAASLLIPPEPVKAYVFASIDATTRRLLGDASKNIAARLDAMTKSGATLEERELVVRELISSQLKPVRDGAIESLSGGEGVSDASEP